MRTPEDIGREIAGRYTAGAWPRWSSHRELVAQVAAEAARLALEQPLAPAAGGGVTPEEVAEAEAAHAAVEAYREWARANPLRKLDELDPAVRRTEVLLRLAPRLCDEVRRLWAVMRDVWEDSASYRHGFAAGWRACRRAAEEVVRRTPVAADYDEYGGPAGDDGPATLARAAGWVRVLEPPEQP